MKNSIKTLTLLLVSILVSNVSKAANYTLNNATWSPSTPNQANLTASDSVIIRGNGTWTLTRAVTANVRISGGTFAQSTFALTGGVSVKGTATISGTGSISGAVTIAFGTLTVSGAKSAGSWVMSGGNLTNSANITGPVSVTATGTLAGTSSVGAVTLTSGTLTVSAAKTASSWTLNGGTLTNSATLTGAISVAGTVTMAGTSSVGAVTVSSGKLTVSATKTASSWTLSGGSLESNSNLTGNVAVSGNATISGTGTLRNLAVSAGTLTLGSNKTTRGLTLSGGTIDLVTYKLTASGDASISGNATIKSSGSGVFSNNSSNTTIGANVTLTIDNAEYITDDLEFNASANDIVTINGGIFSIDASDHDDVIGASASRHINGTVRFYYDGSNTQDTVTLPLGNGTVIAPVRFLFSGNNINNSALTPISGDYGDHYITATYVGAKNSNTGIDNTTLAGGVSGSEYWTISTSSTNPSVKMILKLKTATLNCNFKQYI